MTMNNRVEQAKGAIMIFFYGMDTELGIDGIDFEVKENENSITISATTKKYGSHESVKILDSESDFKFSKEVWDFCETVSDRRVEILEKEEEYDQNAYDNAMEGKYESEKHERN